MEESPNGSFSSQQVPVVGWNMESPQTSVISPRSVVLPRPITESSGSPAGAYFIEQWGTHQRNKRRIKRPPKPNLYKRYEFSSALDTPEKSDSSDFDDWDDEILSQIRLTPLLNKAGSSRQSAEQRPSPSTPVGAGPSGATAKSRTVQAFKTPTMFKTTSSRSSHEQVKVLPRKLTAEFDSVKPSSSLEFDSVKQSSSFQNIPQSFKQSNQIQPTNISCTSKQLTTSVKQTTPQPSSVIDDEDMISDDDEEVLRQVDLLASQLLAPQSSQTKANQLRKQQPPPPPPPATKTVSHQPSTSWSSNKKQAVHPPQAVHRPPVSNTPAVSYQTSSGLTKQPNVSDNKENVKISDDDGFSDDSFDDIILDDETLQRITDQYAASKGSFKQRRPKNRKLTNKRGVKHKTDASIQASLHNMKEYDSAIDLYPQKQIFLDRA